MNWDVIGAFLVAFVVAMVVVAFVEGICRWVSQNSVDDPFE